MMDASDSPKQPSPAEAFAAGTGFSMGFVDATVDASSDANQRNPTPPAPFVLRELIGIGGQGEVWEAWQPSLRRTVAVKIHHAGSVERFAREALLTGELEHPSIVPVLDFGSIAHGSGGASAAAMAMKRLRGERWDEMLRREHEAGAMPRAEGIARHFATLDAVCHAVSFAHSRGVLHLDLKPSQVIVGEFGETYLCDWGMAARMGKDGALDFVSAPEGPFGTPPFMAPEQALADVDSVSPATDVYLLAGLAYFILTARGPHGDATVDELLRRARENRIEPFPAGLPPSVCAAILRGLASAPKERFATAEEFRCAIAEGLRRHDREVEAAALRDAVRDEWRSRADATYADFSDWEQRLGRSLALSPDDAAAALRTEVLRAHAALAIERGDLALAELLAERIGIAEASGSIFARIAKAREETAAREEQRLRARRIATRSLASLVVVLVAASALLYLAFSHAESERRRAEAALRDSRRELARASLQAAMGYLDKLRPSDAREALRRVPEEWRHWEWGMLASRAVPESRLLRPRSERFDALAASDNGSAIVGVQGGRLVALGTQRFAEVPGIVTAVAGGPGGDILAGTASGTVYRFGGAGEVSAFECGSPIAHLAAHGDAPAYAVDRGGNVWRLDGTAARVGIEVRNATALAVSSLGVAVGTRDGAIYHARHGEPLTAAKVLHTAPVAGLRWHPDRPIFVSWAGGYDSPTQGDSRAIIHSAGEADPVHATLEVDVPLTAAAWTPDGERLALAFSNLWLHEFDTGRWSLQRSTQYGVAVAHALHFVDEGRRLLFVSRSMFQIRETQWMGSLLTVRTDARRVHAACFDGSTLYTAGDEGGVAQWRIDRTPDAAVLEIGPDSILSLDASATTDTVLAAHRWGWTKTWMIESEPQPVDAGVSRDYEAVQVRASADAARLAIMGERGIFEIVSTADGASITRGVLGVPARAIAMQPNGSRAAIALGSGGIVSIEARANAEPQPLVRAGEAYGALLHSHDGRWLYAAADRGSVLLLDAASGRTMATLPAPPGRTMRLALDRENRWLVAAREDDTALLWNLAERTLVHTLRGTHSGPVTSAVLTPDARRAITASTDGLLRVFDTRTGIELLSLQGHAFAVTDMVLARDGRTLISGGRDARLRFARPLPWDVGDRVLDEDPSPLRP